MNGLGLKDHSRVFNMAVVSQGGRQSVIRLRLTLSYLIFDASDDGGGTGSWEAMASVRAPDVAAVLAEAQQVIDAAQAQSPGPRAPLDEGGAWDALLQLQPEGDWTVVTLTLTGPWEWGEALLAALAPDA